VFRGALHKKGRLMLRSAHHVTIMFDTFSIGNHHYCYRHTLNKTLAPSLVSCMRHRLKVSVLRHEAKDAHRTPSQHRAWL
jgi:hypothetical protein